MAVAGPVTAAGYGVLTRGSYSPSGGAASALQESVEQFDREASSPSGGSPRSGVTHREFSVQHRTVVAVSVDAGLSRACQCAQGGGGGGVPGALMAGVGWSQALPDCPRGVQVALCLAQKTVPLLTRRVQGLAGVGGGFRPRAQRGGRAFTARGGGGG